VNESDEPCASPCVVTVVIGGRGLSQAVGKILLQFCKNQA
jgi:hypothetical protein